MKYKVMIGRLVSTGSHRAEVGNWLVEVAVCSLTDPEVAPFVDDVEHVPIQ